MHVDAQSPHGSPRGDSVERLAAAFFTGRFLETARFAGRFLDCFAIKPPFTFPHSTQAKALAILT